ncbi:MAG TPA: hypothetical protein VFU21_20695 [Kofleriaceae bacterium]|nr:hypothetical protein [Kofleriaceae bacterium]
MLLAACGSDHEAGTPAADGSPGGSFDGAPAAGGLVITTLVDARPAPVGFVAVQDGDQAWRRLSSSDGSYRAEIASGRYAAVVACGTDTPAVTLVFLVASLDERTSWTMNCQVGGAFARASVEIAGLTGTDRADVSAGSRNEIATAFDPDVELYSLWPGTYDIFASSAEQPRRVAASRDVVLSSDVVATVTIDLAEAVEVGGPEHAITVTGADVDYSANVSFLSRNGTRFGVGGGAGGTYRPLPNAIVEDGDMYLGAATWSNFTDPAFRSGGTWTWFREPTDLTLAMPPRFEAIEVGAASTSPTIRPEMTASYPGATIYDLLVRQPGAQRAVRVTASAARIADGAQHRWVMPDLSEVDGWEDGWGLAPGAGDLEWIATVVAVDGPGGDLAPLDRIAGPPSGAPAGFDGRTESSAEAKGELAP